MENSKKYVWIGSVVALVLYIIFSSAVRDTQLIWILTRVFGLISFAALFIAVTLGELRVLSKIKANFKLFRFHTPLAIFATFTVAAHLASAVLDNYKWGIGLTVTQYLGFSFSDKWLVFLSLGTIAFYLMLIVGLTSRTKFIQKIGYKQWKLVHYLSYIAFVIAYIHAMNLGTDVKYSVIAPYLSVVFILMFFFVISLLLTRIVNGFGAFSDQWEINLAAIFVIVLLVGGVFVGRHVIAKQDQIKVLEGQVAGLEGDIALQQQIMSDLSKNTSQLQGQLTQVIMNGTR
jgi:methionine sulfoxide reductase heme-binding subunit